MAAATTDPCAICLGEISRGQAVFVAECSHTFHHRCISDSVAHGNRDCPLCKATWRVVPSDDPVPAPAMMSPPRAYADDDPVAQQTAVQAQSADGQSPVAGEMSLKTHCEFPAVARDASRDNFAVLVHARAPGLASAADAEAAQRAPVDLVTVLDVRGSMTGSKLALVKRAMRFVINNLGPDDRLSVVSFSSRAKREMRLARMSDDGKASAKLAVESLVACGSTNIGDGLKVASEVLEHRRYRNAVTSVILLSDGQDTCIGNRDFRVLVPTPFRVSGDRRPGPIHTFGFGADHDAAAMHTIAEVTGGTFSFIGNLAVIQDSFAQCIGGLLSVVVQGARILVECAHPGVRVRQVKSGRYESTIDADGRTATVDVGELYAEEERRFLFFLDVPSAEADGEDATQLVKVRCTYRDVATGSSADVAGEDAVVQRPAEVTNPVVSVEVERERIRVAAAEEIVAARDAAERGAFGEARSILGRRLYCMRRSMPVNLAGDPMMEALEEELEECEEDVEDEDEYVATGRARLLTGINARAQQRASFVSSVRKKGGRSKQRGLERQRAPQPYMTTAMKSMLKKSQKAREKQRTSPSPPPPTKRRRGDHSSSSK
ncbi:hypothetical protein HU200_022176 [Digitaria exilis]|uniref:Zinc finger protein n=1 Tax=Digitaria exilis TaxID=1010633 RepID=A0A835C570_9POAL|nr:hypothetical protein HU200_022176 [Digitaria exilis]